MIRIVLDTNVVVSALLSSAGFEDRVLKLALNGYVQLYISPPILAEYERVLNNPKFNFTPVRVRLTLLGIQTSAHMVHPMRILDKCKHEADNRFLECADAARADFVVTGNRRHFPSQWKQTTIVNARQMLERAFPLRR